MNKIKQEDYSLNLVVITANTAGGALQPERNYYKLGENIAKFSPDFIFLQELVIFKKKARIIKNSIEELKKRKLINYHSIFEVVVDNFKNPCPPIVPGTDGKPGKWFKQQFSPYTYAAQGNGFLINSKWKYSKVAKEVISNFGSSFLGNHETEPRCLITVKVKHPSISKEILLACTHLTPLKDEERDKQRAEIASRVRQQQVNKICDILDKERDRVPIILAGDFNAIVGSEELNLFSRSGFECITKLCSDKEKSTGTHCRTRRFIDHIWIRSQQNLVANECGLIKADLTDETDHRPVWARINFENHC